MSKQASETFPLLIYLLCITNEAKRKSPSPPRISRISALALTTVSLRLGYGAGALSFGDKGSKRRWRSGDRGRARSFPYLFRGVLFLCLSTGVLPISLLSFQVRAFMLRLVRLALPVPLPLAIQGESQPHFRFFRYPGRARLKIDRVGGSARACFYSLWCAPCLKLVNKQTFFLEELPPSSSSRSFWARLTGTPMTILLPAFLVAATASASPQGSILASPLSPSPPFPSPSARTRPG